MSFQRPHGAEFGQQDRYQPDLHRDIFDTRLDPRLSQQEEGKDFEELYEPIDHELSSTDKALFGIRIAIIVFFVICSVLVILDIFKGNLRLKCWRLYLTVTFSVSVWLGLSIYQDHIDEYFVQVVSIIPQKRSIFWCFRNMVHGLTLYLVVLLLSRMSDFAHRGWWFFAIFGVTLVPLLFSIALLIIDLSLDPDKRLSTGWNVAIDTVRVLLYNVITSVVCIVFAQRFCTSRRQGSYSESRSSFSVLISRWTLIFLVLHNLTAITSYAAVVASRVNTTPGVLERSTEVHRALEEILLFFLVMSIPVSYLAGIISSKFCLSGVEDQEDMELNKAWTTPGDDIPPSTTVTGSTRPVSKTSTTDGISTNPNAKGAQSGVQSRAGQGSSTTIQSIDFTLAQPSSSSNNGSTNGLAELAKPNTGQAGVPKTKKRNRESYLEAVSSDHFQEIIPSKPPPGRDTGRISTEPIDL